MPTTSGDEIAAEIADHLAIAADRLQEQGIAAAEAEQKAEAAFGDRKAISRRCYWIKEGDSLMFRAAVIGLLAIVCIALAVTIVGSWRAQTRMAEQMGALAEELKALAQQQAAAPAAAGPLEIKGRAYLGSPDKAAANTEMMICRVDDGEIVRRVSTVTDGSFRSGPLPAGDYSIIAKQDIGIQSAPIYLYPGAQTPNVELNVAHPKGRVAVKLSQPLHRIEVKGKYIIDSRLYLRMQLKKVLRYRRWTTKSPMPDRWPLFIDSPELSLSQDTGFELASYAVLTNPDLSHAAVSFSGNGKFLTAGPYELTAAVVSDVKPYGTGDKLPRPGHSSADEPKLQWLDTVWIFRGYMGTLWFNKLVAEQRANRPPAFPTSFRVTSKATSFDLEDGKLTRLEIEIPTDAASRVQELVETRTDAKDFAEAVNNEKPFVREVNLKVVGTEPLQEDTTGKETPGSAQ